MSTRDRILDMALKLFNQRGIDNVSIRDIAAELNISDGNLRYHFRTRDDLVEALFQRLVDTIGSELMGAVGKHQNILLMRHLLGYLMQRFYEYRFIVQDLLSLTHNYPNIKKTFFRITTERLVITKAMYQAYIDNGYIVPEPYPGHYDQLLENSLILSHFWINGAQLFYHGKPKDIVAHYTSTIFSLFYPYFTEKAMKELALAESNLSAEENKEAQERTRRKK